MARPVIVTRVDRRAIFLGLMVGWSSLLSRKWHRMIPPQHHCCTFPFFSSSDASNVGDLFMTTNSCVKSFVQEWCGYIFGCLCFLCCDFWRTQCTVAARMVARLVGHMVDAIVAMQQATFSCRNWPKKAHHYNSHDRVQSMSRSRQC
jgi:hypothetical protein